VVGLQELQELQILAVVVVVHMLLQPPYMAVTVVQALLLSVTRTVTQQPHQQLVHPLSQ
jgi:hypothetical protein